MVRAILLQQFLACKSGSAVPSMPLPPGIVGLPANRRDTAGAQTIECVNESTEKWIQ